MRVLGPQVKAVSVSWKICPSAPIKIFPVHQLVLWFLNSKIRNLNGRNGGGGGFVPGRCRHQLLGPTVRGRVSPSSVLRFSSSRACLRRRPLPCLFSAPRLLLFLLRLHLLLVLVQGFRFFSFSPLKTDTQGVSHIASSRYIFIAWHIECILFSFVQPQVEIKSFPAESIKPLAANREGTYIAGGGLSGDIYFWEVILFYFFICLMFYLKIIDLGIGRVVNYDAYSVWCMLYDLGCQW